MKLGITTLSECTASARDIQLWRSLVGNLDCAVLVDSSLIFVDTVMIPSPACKLSNKMNMYSLVLMYTVAILSNAMCGSDINSFGGVLSDAMEFVHCVEIYLANIGRRMEHLYWCAIEVIVYKQNHNPYVACVTLALSLLMLPFSH